MREVLFRGKRKDNGEWVEGFLTIDPTICDYVIDIVGVTSIIIYPHTVGQYTGLTDKNGKKIFEGDIIKHYCNCEDKTVFDVGQIYWCENICQYRRTSRIEGQFYDVNTSCEYEVIGNIHDNPELLKGGAE